MGLPTNRIKNINITETVEQEQVNTSYSIVPEMLGKNGYSAELPTLTGNTTLVISSDIANIEKTPLISGTAAAAVTLDPYKVYDFGTLTLAMTISLNAGTSGYCAEYSFRFTAGTGAAITLPNNCKYVSGTAPTITSGHTYEYNIIDNLVVVGDFFTESN